MSIVEFTVHRGLECQNFPILPSPLGGGKVGGRGIKTQGEALPPPPVQTGIRLILYTYTYITLIPTHTARYGQPNMGDSAISLSTTEKIHQG
jgi:hypothetical protein